MRIFPSPPYFLLALRRMFFKAASATDFFQAISFSFVVFIVYKSKILYLFEPYFVSQVIVHILGTHANILIHEVVAALAIVARLNR
jgi:hypothetical protein